ncbi:MAG TPA: DUF4097 family beta strand repeat-containing protein [Vicinamibacterales bacterium]|nr:DUF4097 family beta strand repeat-containing protein [Vicinamibacterales bacterium]
MKTILCSVFTVAVVAAAGHDVAAQEPAPPSRERVADPAWVQELERQIERHVEAASRALDAALETALGQNRAPQPPRPPRAPRPPREAAGPEFTESFSRTVRLGRNGTFDLQNVAGDIVVTGSGGDEVRIDATKRVRRPTEREAREILKALQIRIVERAGSVEVRTEYPRWRGVSASVDYAVTVPRDGNVTIRGVAGDIRVSNVRGELRVESVSGDIALSSVGRVREVKSVSGTIEVTDAEGDEIQGSTVSGSVIARNLRARAVALQSVSGTLRFDRVDAARALLRTISGDIEYGGRLSRSGRYELRSHSGDLRVVPAGDPGLDVEANTFSGSLRSDYALQLREFGGPGRAAGRTLRGTIGDGSAALVLQSFSGDIVIVKE